MKNTLQGGNLFFITAFLLFFVKGEVRFSVDEVCPEPFPIDEDFLDAKQALHSKMGDHDKFMGWGSQHDKLYTQSSTSLSNIPNSFVQTVHNAYGLHYPLTLSPDHIWTAIIQAFGIHVKMNSERLRDKFVSFDGKQKLKVERDYMPQGAEWQPVLQDFNNLIKGFVGDNVYDIISPNFSTTGVLERTVANVAIMDSFQNYFDYEFAVLCGIPEIKLLGSVEDWEMILQKFQQLAQFDLQFWVQQLSPVLEEFVQASKGNVNTTFWQQVYSIELGCGGPPEISGWIMSFFPYLLKTGGEKAGEYELASDRPFGTRSTKIPSGISTVPVKFLNSTEYDLKFYAGFIGLTQDQQMDYSLKPSLGWGVVAESKITDESPVSLTGDASNI